MLARGGVQVHIVERLPHVGGRCSAIEADGFRFDLGPTFFLYPTVLERIFKLIGRDLHAEVPMERLDPQYRIAFGGGGELNCTPDLAKLEAEVAKISPSDAPNVRRFLDDNRVKMEKFRPCLESPFLSWRNLLSWDLIKLLPILRPWQSLDRELSRYFRDPRIRLAFSFQSKYLGMSPFNCPSLFSILSFLEYEYGVWHPIGGCSAVSESMARIAREMGVTFSLGEEVKEVLFDGRRAVGVRTAAGEYRADAVVINADFAQAMRRLVPDRLRRRWTDAKVARKQFSCSTFMMYLGIEGRYDDVPHHTIHTAADYATNLADIEDLHVLSEDPSFYVQNACVTDDTLAPKGCSTLYVLAPGHAPPPERGLGEGGTRVPLANVPATREDRTSRCRETHPLREDRDAGRLGKSVRRVPRRNVQPGPHASADAAPEAAQSLRGSRRRLSRRRRHASGQRVAGDLRVGPHHEPTAACGPRQGCGMARQARREGSAGEAAASVIQFHGGSPASN